MKKILVLTFLWLGAVGSVMGQYGGSAGFQFLNLPTSSRNAALSGRIISIVDNDLNLAIGMPSLLDSTDHDQIVFNYTPYLGDINYGNVAFARHYDGIATFGAALQYVSYGDFLETNEYGEEFGSFSSGEYVLNLMASRQIDSSFSVGGAMKLFTSNLQNYNASGVAFDVSGNYRSRDGNFSAGVLLRNMGFAFDKYNPGEDLDVPFGIDLGFSRKLANSPLRFNLMLENLQKWDLTYIDPAFINRVDPLTGLVIEIPEESFVVKAMHHVNFGAEFLLSDNFHLRFGYNYRRRAELKFDRKPATAGISWGIAFRVNRFKLSYGRANYNQAGTTNNFSISTNLREFR